MVGTEMRPARWQDFTTTVRPLFPRASAEEIEVRARLLLIRDLSICAMAHSQAEAYYMLKAVTEMAGRFALDDLTLDQLKEARRILILTTTNASAMQVLMNEIHYGAGEENARG
jgi:hypothetical protein